jgi:hypothetical protein
MIIGRKYASSTHETAGAWHRADTESEQGAQKKHRAEPSGVGWTDDG